MKLSVNTELGEFKFNLSQTSVIYLLGLAQQLEDEGETAIKGDSAYKINTPPVVETEKQEEEPLFPADDPEEETKEEAEQEDFGELLEEFDQKQKRQWNEAPRMYEPADGKYKGFLYIKCDHCGETRGFNAKYATDEYKCSECGGKTRLKGLRPVHMDCECGKHWKYLTNETAEVITINCINCGQPVDTMLNPRRTAYKSIGGGITRKATGVSRIATGRFKW